MARGKDTSEPEMSGRSGLPVWLAVAVGIFAFIVYLLTLSPGVSWAHHSEDSGDLITAAWTLGIPHPTGYPLYCILGWIWSHVFDVGSVAWRMNLMSAIFGALASMLTVHVVWISFDLADRTLLERITPIGRKVASVSAGLVLAFATDVWSLSIVSEVYSLNLFFTALITLLIVEILAGAKAATEDGDTGWSRRRGKLLLMLGVSVGLALTNHLTSIFLLPGIIVVLVFGKTGLNAREMTKAVLGGAVALLIYLYLPIRSAMNPPLDWGNPETLPNLIWMVSGQQFRKLMFVLMPYQALYQVMKFNSVPYELGGLGAFAGLMGVCRLIMGRTRHEFLFLIYTLLMAASSLFYLASYAIRDPEGYLHPIIFATVIWSGWAIALAVSVPDSLVKLTRTLAIILLLLSPLNSLIGHWNSIDLSGNREAMNFGEETFKNLEENALIIEVPYERAFTLWYYREVEYKESRDDVAVIFLEHAGFEWGLDLLKRKYPDLLLPAEPLPEAERDPKTAAWIIENNIDRRPVYIGATVDELVEKGYRFEGTGLIFRVYPPDNK